MSEGFQRYSSSEMGARDSKNSDEDWKLQEIEKLICLILSDNPREVPQVLPAQKTIGDLVVDEKINYFEQVYSNIKITKKSFLDLYDRTNDCIDRMTTEVMLRMKNCNEKLKAQLLLLKRSKVVKWNIQMAICAGILNDFQRLDSSRNFGNDTAVEEILKSHRISELEFVHSGKIKMNLEPYSRILENIERLSVVNCDSELDTHKMGCIAPKFTFGTVGGEAGQFCRPWGVCCDGTGRILVCDRSNHRVQVFNEGGQFLIQFGKEGSKPGEFSRPSGVTVDSECRIIIADKDNHRIQVFTYSGRYMFTFGKQGTKPGHFNYPWDVAVNKACEIAVSDSKNHRIQLFTETGAFLRLFDARTAGIENPRAGLKFLDSPRGLAFCPDGSLLVTDFNNHRILLINHQFSGATKFGSEGQEPMQFFRPQGIACDSRGRFAVADCKNYRIQVFNANWTIKQIFGSQGDAPGQFDCPQGISFHPNQNIVVVDFNNNRVQVF